MMWTLVVGAAMAQTWPAINADIEKSTLGVNDAALVIGIEDYAFIPDVPGARANADDWYMWLTRGRGVPTANVRLLRDSEATAEKIRRFSAEVSEQVGRGGTVWLVFVGHGAPNGATGMLVGADAQADADSLFARSVSQDDLLKALSAGAEGQVVAVVDSCFSGKTPTGNALVEGVQFVIPARATAPPTNTLLLTAGRADQFAGPLPGASRPAFSYLALGAMRGWGDQNGDGAVTAGEVVAYAGDALDMLLIDRGQDPQLQGDGAAVLARGREAGPDLSAFVLSRPATTTESYDGLRIQIPKSQPIAGNFEGIGDVDIRGEQLLDAALTRDEDPWATPTEKREAWCTLASYTREPPLGPPAEQACSAWRTYIEQLESFEAQISKDYLDVMGLLALARRSDTDKLAALERFSVAYGAVPDDRRVLAVRRAKAKIAEGKGARLPATVAHSRVGPGEPDPYHWVSFPEDKGNTHGFGLGISYGVAYQGAWVGGAAIYDQGWFEGTARVGTFTETVVLDLEPGLILTSWPNAAFTKTTSVVNPVVGPSLRLLLKPGYDEIPEVKKNLDALDYISGGLFVGNMTWLETGMALRFGLTVPLTDAILGNDLPFQYGGGEYKWGVLGSMDIYWAGRWHGRP